jgi:hypothetical protein
MAVLGWSLGTLLYSYFYLWLYSAEWPQDGLRPPELLPDGGAYLAIPLAAGAFAAGWSACRRRRKLGCLLGLAAGCALLAASLGFHLIQLGSLAFSPGTNAYASIFFVLSWALDVILIIGLGLAGTALARAWIEVEHWQLYVTLNVQMSAHYGYFAAAAAAVVYATLYLSPHVI